MSFRKVGGLTFLRLGRLHVSWSLSRKRRVKALPTWHLRPFYLGD